MNLQTDLKTSFILFSLQHVTKPTRKGKTLIDHTSSNISTKVIHCNVVSTCYKRYSVLKKNTFKNDTNMYEMRKT